MTWNQYEQQMHNITICNKFIWEPLEVGTISFPVYPPNTEVQDIQNSTSVICFVCYETWFLTLMEEHKL